MIGLPSASAEYSITQEGWIGEVTEMSGSTIWVKGKHGSDPCHYPVEKVYFKKYVESTAPGAPVTTVKPLIDRVKIGDIVRCVKAHGANLDNMTYIKEGWRGKVVELDKGDKWDLELEGLNSCGVKTADWCNSECFELI